MCISGISALLFGICISAVHGSVQQEPKVEEWGLRIGSLHNGNSNNHHHDGTRHHEGHGEGSRNHARDSVTAISERHTFVTEELTHPVFEF